MIAQETWKINEKSRKYDQFRAFSRNLEEKPWKMIIVLPFFDILV